MAETKTYEDGWQPMESVPLAADYWSPSGGLGVNVALDEDYEALFLLWYEDKGGGGSSPVRWRPLPEAPHGI